MRRHGVHWCIPMRITFRRDSEAVFHRSFEFIGLVVHGMPSASNLFFCEAISPETRYASMKLLHRDLLSSCRSLRLCSMPPTSSLPPQTRTNANKSHTKLLLLSVRNESISRPTSGFIFGSDKTCGG